MFEKKFYGTATIGEKGQIVIPVEARNELGIKTGDKLLVLSGLGQSGLVLVKSDVLKKFAEHLTDKLGKMQSIIDDEK